MTLTTARVWLIYASLLLVGAEVTFLALAPVVGFPLEYSQAIKLIEITFPVLLGYLGSAAYFVVGAADQTPNPHAQTAPEFGLMVRGPVLVFAFATIVTLVAFAISNRANAAPGEGMSFDSLSGILTLILGILTATTSVISAHIFGRSPGSSGGLSPNSPSNDPVTKLF
jgi:hypothetical protein